MKKGWKCPKCETIISPYEKTCPICNPFMTLKYKYIDIKEVRENPWDIGPSVTMYAVNIPDMIVRYGVGIIQSGYVKGE